MSEALIAKLERPGRVAALVPQETLARIGFDDPMVLCDIGAGTGVFTFAAAALSTAPVFALDTSEAALEVLAARKEAYGHAHVAIRQVTEGPLPVEDAACDVVLLVTVLHEVADGPKMLQEIKRILKADGRLLVIEFHKRETPSGPPLDHRMAEETVDDLCHGQGFSAVERFTLGDDFYAIVFQRASK